ncbi:MAG: hypothetical protein KBD66_03120 [Candidatus Doudnabacteria bacterium]|nr:hypothetical protein [Candidatus Doudnabacteria bacterium]
MSPVETIETWVRQDPRFVAQLILAVLLTTLLAGIAVALKFLPKVRGVAASLLFGEVLAAGMLWLTAGARLGQLQDMRLVPYYAVVGVFSIFVGYFFVADGKLSGAEYATAALIAAVSAALCAGLYNIQFAGNVLALLAGILAIFQIALWVGGDGEFNWVWITAGAAAVVIAVAVWYNGARVRAYVSDITRVAAASTAATQ